MGVEVRRGASLLAMTVPILIMLLHAHICRAMSPVRGNSSTSGCCNGDQEEWLVGDISSSSSEEFLMGSEPSRRILDTVRFTDGSKNAKKPALDCGQGKGYRTCLPGKNGVRPTQNCGDYTRDCR